MKAIVLVDNISRDNLAGEWGLSIYIEYAGNTILLDAGASGVFLQNANSLGLILAAWIMPYYPMPIMIMRTAWPYFFKRTRKQNVI